MLIKERTYHQVHKCLFFVVKGVDYTEQNNPISGNCRWWNIDPTVDCHIRVVDGQINIIMIVLLFNKKKTMNSKSEKEKNTTKL